jgi:hypothetical protein
MVAGALVVDLVRFLVQVDAQMTAQEVVKTVVVAIVRMIVVVLVSMIVTDCYFMCCERWYSSLFSKELKKKLLFFSTTFLSYIDVQKHLSILLFVTNI